MSGDTSCCGCSSHSHFPNKFCFPSPGFCAASGPAVVRAAGSRRWKKRRDAFRYRWSTKPVPCSLGNAPALTGFSGARHQIEVLWQHETGDIGAEYITVHTGFT